MKKNMRKKVLIILLSLLLLTGVISVPVLAASWKPEDKITITVRVFNPNTGGVWVVGSDTCTKGDEKIQSDAYRIPDLSEFIGENSYRVQKVAGNWYFPTGDRNVGTNVYWSCNSSTATMTYWVPGFVPPTPSGSGDPAPTPGPTSGSKEEGSGKYTIHFTIIYHSNYPGSTNREYPQYSMNHTVNAGYNIGNTGWTETVLTPAEAGFSVPNGYVQAAVAWKDKNGQGVNKMLSVKNNGTYHLYAQWIPSNTAEHVTLTHIDRDDEYATYNYLKGDTVNVIDCDIERDNHAFKGWDTSSEAKTVVYAAADTFEITEHTTLYAVWEQNVPEVKYTVIYTDGVEGEVIFEDKTFTDLAKDSATPAFGENPTRTGYVFAGWNPEVAETVTDNAVYTAAWKADRNNNGIADEDEEKFSVIYKDGAEGAVFEDQIYENLLSGDHTPAFRGESDTAATPTREGYVFAGWNPEVAETVTGNAVYTATWKADRNHNTIADEDEDKYTVIYKDGAEDVIFPEQVYENLLAGDPTPAFNGTPEREGYTFAGWDIIVTDTVTGNATYTARWEQSVKPTGDNTAAVAAAAIAALLAAAAAIIISRRRAFNAN